MIFKTLWLRKISVLRSHHFVGQELGDGVAGQLTSAPHIITLRSSAGTGVQDSSLTVLKGYCWLFTRISWSWLFAGGSVEPFSPSPWGLSIFLATCSCVYRTSVPRDRDELKNLRKSIILHYISQEKITKTSSESMEGNWAPPLNERRSGGAVIFLPHTPRSVITSEIAGWFANPHSVFLRAKLCFFQDILVLPILGLGQLLVSRPEWQLWKIRPFLRLQFWPLWQLPSLPPLTFQLSQLSLKVGWT